MVDFIAMAVAFGDFGFAVDFGGFCAFFKGGWVIAEAHRVAGALFALLIFRDANDIFGGFLVDFFTVSSVETGEAGGGDDGGLEAEADAEVGLVFFEGVSSGGDFAFDASVAKAARYEKSVNGGEVFFGGGFGVDPFEVEAYIFSPSSGFESFGDREVGVGVVGVFGDEADGDGFLRLGFDTRD